MSRLSLIGFLTLCLGAAGALAATTVTPVDPAFDTAGAAAPVLLSKAELEGVVAPIALYPDDLIAIVLPASTYPLQVVQAARFLEDAKSNTSIKPDEAWDDSIVALTNYPEVVELLNRDLDWTWQLGQAVINQQADVLDAVKGFRERAHLAGNLETDARQVVQVTPEAIAIKPADPKVIYVPYYEPAQVTVVQREPVYHYYPVGYPVYYYPYPADYAFGWPHFWGVSSFYSLGWNTHHVHVHHHHDYGHPYYSQRYWDRHWYRQSRPWYADRSPRHHWNDNGGRYRNRHWQHDRHRGGARQDGWRGHDRDRRSHGDWARHDSRGQNARERNWATTTRGNPLPSAERRPRANRDADTFRNDGTFRSRWNGDQARQRDRRDGQQHSAEWSRRQEYASRQGFQPRESFQPRQHAQRERQHAQRERQHAQREQPSRHQNGFRSRQGSEARSRFQARPNGQESSFQARPNGHERQGQRAHRNEQQAHARNEQRAAQREQRHADAAPSRHERGGNPRADGGFNGRGRNHR